MARLCIGNVDLKARRFHPSAPVGGRTRMGFALALPWLVLAVLFFFYMKGPWNEMASPSREKVARIKADMRSIATSLEAFHVENSYYPIAAPMTRLGEVPPGKRGNWNPTIIFPGGSARDWDVVTTSTNVRGITTPVAYMTTNPHDPYSLNAKGKTLPIAYYNDNKGGWILVSPGPDEKFNIDPTRDYDSATTVPSVGLILKRYDPSNGTTSSGDIYRFKD